LTDFGAVDHEAKTIGFYVFAAYYETMIHCGMQAGFVTVITRIYAGLHVDIVHVALSYKVMYEATCIQYVLIPTVGTHYPANSGYIPVALPFPEKPSQLIAKLSSNYPSHFQLRISGISSPYFSI
jgi:hypothetical protein